MATRAPEEQSAICNCNQLDRARVLDTCGVRAYGLHCMHVAWRCTASEQHLHPYVIAALVHFMLPQVGKAVLEVYLKKKHRGEDTKSFYKWRGDDATSVWMM